MEQSTRKRGLLLVIIGASLWGIGGTVSQKLFQQFSIEAGWLVSTRLCIAGILLLLIQFTFKNKSQILQVWKNKGTAIHLVIFGLFGMLAVQYTYMASIQHGNAAVATLLQYLSPVFIMLYLLIRRKTTFAAIDLLMIALALMGCFLLLTNGSISTLSVSNTAIFWGILSGVSAAFYTLYGAYLLKQFDSLVIVGWAMIIGGAGFSFIHPPWKIDVSLLTGEVLFYLAFVILFGTMIAFWFYIESMQSLSPKETSLFGSLEPLLAVLTTVFWLHELFGLFQWFGTVCIIVLVLFLSLNKKNSQTKPIIE